MPSSWTLVVLSLAALALAPVLALALVRRPALAAGLDSFVLVSVGGVVALHVVPHSARVVGPSAFLVSVIGLLLPIALHRVDDALAPTGRDAARTARNVVVYALVALGLVVHALFDGAALSSHSESLALGVLAHRLPAGLALWVVVRPRVGTARTALLLALYAGGTAAGAAFGDALATSAGAPALALVQAFVAGSILHVVIESPPLALAASSSGKLAGLLGACVAAGALVVVSHDEPTAPALIDALVRSGLAMAPAALASFVLVGLLSVRGFDDVPRLPPGASRIIDAGAGTVSGLTRPLCSCAVAPLYDELDARGASPASARAFLVAAPALGVPALLVTARLFGVGFLALRVAVAGTLALAAGLAAPGRGAGSSPPPTSSSAPPLTERVRHGMRHGLVDAVDHVGPWLVAGAAAAAAIATSLPPSVLPSVPAPLHPVIAAVVALPLYLCAAGTTPVALVLVSLGLSPGGALALLLVGPATSLATLAHLRRRAGTRAAAVHGAVVLLGAIALGLAVDAATLDLPTVADEPPSTTASTGALLAALALAGLLLASLWRQGVRGALVQVMSPQHRHAADHTHGPGCDHDHGPPVPPPVPLGLLGSTVAGTAASPVAQGAPRVRLSFDPRSPPPQDPPR
ncbi:MAG: permease [Deltaproteobacteria bacterium]|nr:permease [Deltaproteobacteria bacterium]